MITKVTHGGIREPRAINNSATSIKGMQTWNWAKPAKGNKENKKKENEVSSICKTLPIQ